MIEILKFIYKHPLNSERKIKSIFKFITWQISSTLWGGSFIYNWIDNSRLIISKGMTGATGNIYVGLMEYEDMSFLLHYLQEDDLFYDIGANVGVYTILASKVKKAKTISIEPIPSTYEHLIDNIQINRLDNVITKNIGLSSEKSKLFFTTNRDAMNSVALSSDKDTIEVEVDTLDNLSKRFGYPKMIKIDVEGYETNVIKGGMETLKNPNVEVIIIELNGNGNKFLFNDNDIHNILLSLDYYPYTYNPFERKIIKLNHYGSHNTIYIKNSVLSKIENRIKDSKQFNCEGRFL